MTQDHNADLTPIELLKAAIDCFHYCEGDGPAAGRMKIRRTIALLEAQLGGAEPDRSLSEYDTLEKAHKRIRQLGKLAFLFPNNNPPMPAILEVQRLERQLKAHSEAIQDQDNIEDTPCCWNCGGEGVIDGECSCMEDCCACLEPEPPTCGICKGKGYI